MSTSSIPPSSDSTTVPSIVSDTGLADSLEPTDAEAIRRDHRREEAYWKVLIKANLLYAILCGAQAAYLSCFAYLHLTGKSNAPWIVRPGWIASQVLWYLTATLALAASYGFLRRKRWAIPVEGLFVLFFVLHLPIGIFVYSGPKSPGHLAALATVWIALLVPVINFMDIPKSKVYDHWYAQVIAATPGIRVRGRLSWGLKLTMLPLLVIAVILWYYSSKL